MLLLLAACTSPKADAPPLDDTGAEETGAEDTADTGPEDTAGTPTFADEARWSIANDWEPTLAAAGSDVWEATTRLEALQSRVVLRHSPDGGANWEPDVQANPADTNAFDPQVAIAADTGCVYAGWLDDTWHTFVASSCDDGATWSEPVSIRGDDEWTDHGWLLVSPDGQDVTVGYSGTLWTDTDELGHGYVVASHDGGRTFGEPWEVTPVEDRYWFVSFGARGGDGSIWYTAEIYTTDYHGPSEMYLWRSVDAGETFESILVAVSEEPPDCTWAAGCSYGFLTSQLAVAADVDGHAVVAWHGTAVAGEEEPLYVATVDWPTVGPPVLLATGGNHAFPMLATGGSTGDFRLLYMADTGGGTAWNTWYQASEDGGLTWLDGAVRLSNLPDGAAYKSEAGFAFPYGDYNGLAVDGEGLAHAIWSEGTSYDGPGGSWSTRELAGG